MPTIVNRLKSEARGAAMRRGHILEEFEFTGRSYLSRCIHCGMEVQVIPRPRPNEINIGGEAVAVNCTRTRSVPKLTILSNGGRFGEGSITFIGSEPEGSLDLTKVLFEIETTLNLASGIRAHATIELIPEVLDVPVDQAK